MPILGSLVLHTETLANRDLLRDGRVVDCRAMNRRTTIATVFTSLSCLALVGFLLTGHPNAAAAAKIAASTGFLLVAVFSGALESKYGKTLFLGLVCSFAGDAFLIGESRGAFLLGLSAFLLAHITYVVAFTIRGVNLRWMALAAIPIFITAIAVSAWLMPHTPSELTVPVVLYIIVISTMVIAAIGTRGKGGPVLILAGALLFFLSDLSVASLRLVQTTFPTYIWGLPFYYAGQLCLAVSASQSRSR